MKLAAALARRSNHPISQAVAKIARGDFALTDWQEVRGAGVQARCNWRGDSTPTVARLGSLRWLRESGVDLEPRRAFEAEWSAQGAHVAGHRGGQAVAGNAGRAGRAQARRGSGGAATARRRA